MRVPNSTIEWDNEVPEFGWRKAGKRTEFVLRVEANGAVHLLDLTDSHSLSVNSARVIAKIILNLCNAICIVRPVALTHRLFGNAQTPNSASKKLLSYDELKSEMGITHSRRNLRRLEDQGKFPKRVKLGHRTVAWVAAEIEQHLSDSMKLRRN